MSATRAFRLGSPAGLEAQVASYGATLVSLRVPDREGRAADVVLGFDSLDRYLAEHPYFGSTIGRFGNRIRRGVFELDGKTNRLPVNDGPNHLHGGPRGFHTVAWDVLAHSSNHVTLSYLSPDGEQGYPGNLEARITYALIDDALVLEYEASTDAPTVVNLTNHAYFNLAGGGTILDHELTIDASRYLPVDETRIPTGELRAVDGGAFDFTSAKRIGADIQAADEQLERGRGGYDHCWVLDREGEGLAFAAELLEPTSGRRMTVHTTQPAVQFYSGNLLDGSVAGKGGVRYERYAAFCLETQHFPDSPNRPEFPSTVLRPGQTYRHTTRYAFSWE